VFGDRVDREWRMLDGGGTSQIFVITAGAVSISGLTFTHGAGQIGGAIRDMDLNMPLTIISSAFTSNTAGVTGGGAIEANGPLTVSDSSFTGNSAGGAGGEGSAILVELQLTVVNSSFSANTAGAYGGAIGTGTNTPSGGPVITNSTFTGNRAGGAGAKGYRGALYMTAATLASDTIDGNSAGANGTGGGIHANSYQATVDGSIVAGNSAGTGANCDTPVSSSSYSLEGPAGSTSCGFGLTSPDPLLGPLTGNGGATQTQALLVGSPAIDAIPLASCPTNADQRGLGRPDTGESRCDLGAFESAGAPTVSIVTPANGARYTVGQVVGPSFSCLPGANGGVLVAGTAGCLGTVANGTPVDTSTPGGVDLDRLCDQVYTAPQEVRPVGPRLG
jgi:predicted outer membrane repeat protein